MFYPGIERKVSQLREELNITSPPVDLDKVLDHYELTVDFKDFGEKNSGVLYVKEGKGIIGVNLNHVKERKRFTIAHEIGHYVLHKKKGEQLFVEDYLYRDQETETGEKRQEREANAFAAALLMPKDLLAKEVKENQLDVSHESAIETLAEKFKVSQIAMTYRLTNLKWI